MRDPSDGGKGGGGGNGGTGRNGDGEVRDEIGSSSFVPIVALSTNALVEKLKMPARVTNID